MADIEIEFAPPLAWLRLNRPDRLNAMTQAMWFGLADCATALDARSDVRVVLVEGAGGNFCAGADIFAFDEVFAEAESAREYLTAIERGLFALASLEQPTIALLEGASIGGGLAVALSCDLRFAAEDAHIAIPPAKLGLLYGPVETRRLVGLVGPARAKDLLFSGRRIETLEALAIGLIDRRFSPALLRSEAEAYAKDLAALSRTSIRGAKAMVGAMVAGVAENSLREAIEAAALGEDFREGRAAFREKRKPNFV
jgi:enoyl-CoA hydratase/carnithine racemase